MSNSINDFVIQNGVLVKYMGKDKKLVIPKDIKEIADLAFSKNDYVA